MKKPGKPEVTRGAVTKPSRMMGKPAPKPMVKKPARGMTAPAAKPVQMPKKAIKKK